MKLKCAWSRLSGFQPQRHQRGRFRLPSLNVEGVLPPTVNGNIAEIWPANPCAPLVVTRYLPGGKKMMAKIAAHVPALVLLLKPVFLIVALLVTVGTAAPFGSVTADHPMFRWSPVIGGTQAIAANNRQAIRANGLVMEASFSSHMFPFVMFEFERRATSSFGISRWILELRNTRAKQNGGSII